MNRSELPVDLEAELLSSQCVGTFNGVGIHSSGSGCILILEQLEIEVERQDLEREG